MKIRDKNQLINYIDTNELFEFSVFENQTKECTFKSIMPLDINDDTYYIDITYLVDDDDLFIFSKEPFLNIIKKEITSVVLFSVSHQNSFIIFNTFEDDI